MANEKNTITVELYDLPITDRKDDRFGKVVTSRSIKEEDLIKMAVSRRTDLSPATLRASLEILQELAIECLMRGDSVWFGLGYLSLDVKGVFYGDHAKWDPKQHSLNISIIPSNSLRKAINSLTVNVRGMAAVGTVINSITDITTGEVNTVLTLGGGINLMGRKIKIAGDDPANGIYLIEQGTGNEILIARTSVLKNDPSKVSFIMPLNMLNSNYRLKITTQFTTGRIMLKEPRSYIFQCPLTIIGRDN